jgi:hypothetical protein
MAKCKVCQRVPSCSCVLVNGVCDRCRAKGLKRKNKK